MTETRRLTKTTTLRLSEAEVVALREAADAQGLGPSALARVLVMRGIGRKVTARKRRSDLAKVLAAILGELGRWGNNLNQLSVHRHSGGNVDAPALADLTSAVERLTAVIMSLREVSDDPHS